MHELKKKQDLNNIDIVDFWEELDSWDDLPETENLMFSDEYAKAAFVFLEYQPKRKVINLAKLESFYISINTGNLPYKKEDMKKKLKIVSL